MASQDEHGNITKGVRRTDKKRKTVTALYHNDGTISYNNQQKKGYN